MSLMLFKRIVITSNDIVDRIWIAIGIDKRHDRNAQFISFSNSDMLVAWIDNDQQVQEACSLRERRKGSDRA